ncbi:DUF6969 family protein [Martelella radicis]|uniref:DUF6969 domain-containing protein n=1 Tax=Martelella radicis TaxID=1397476 RepID=A0A7W6PCL6_9HYPH|nr:hypothetical protein [Martelella radicis]MBB4123804.1 hypothetical protein [Martelella radicis]
MDEDRQRAAAEALFCEAVLAKTGDSVLLDTLAGVNSPTSFEHYPQGDVYDPESGAQWYYHSHAPAGDSGEHGHFHCFLRPLGPDGPVHHLIAVGVDAHGRLVRLFTVNQWVVGDDWLAAEDTIALLPRFDVHLGRPSYLVNRWLTAIIRLYGDEIAGLIRSRDSIIAQHRPAAPSIAAHDDRALEVTAELVTNLEDKARSAGALP